MRITKTVFENVINFLIIASQNQSQLKYIIFNYFHGSIFAYLLWNYVVFDLYLVIEPFWILCVMIIGFGVMSSMFISVRCVFTIIWLEFLGKAGINVLKAIVIVAVISGPIENLSANAKEVIRVFRCSSELMFNLSLSKVTLVSKPFQNAIRDVSMNLSQIQDSLAMIKNVIHPLTNEIETPFDQHYVEDLSNKNRLEDSLDANRQQIQAKMYYRKYIAKVNDRCIWQLESASDKCYTAFADAYDRCYTKLPMVVNTLLCWSIKIDSICNVLKHSDIGKVCDSANILDRDFGDKYDELKTLQYSLQKKNYHKIYIDTNMTISPIAELRAIKEMNTKFNIEIDRKAKIVLGCVYIIRKILSLVFLHTILGAYGYYRKYLSRIEFDNRFVTKYFEKIDLRRKNRGQMSLLPLKPIERKSIIVSKSSKIELNELWFMVPFLIKLMFEIIFASCFVIFNKLLYVGLVSVAKNGEISYQQEGELIMQTEVNGTGVVALLIKQFLENFNINESVSTVYSNNQCLPRPTELSKWYLVQIYGIYLAIILFKLNLAFILRMRTTIMASFFPKREKVRILHLYNECLKKRKRMHRSTKKMLFKKLRNDCNTEANIFMMLIEKFAPHLNWLRIIACLRRKCWICTESESFGSENILINSDENEQFYCKECWDEFSAIFDEIQLKCYSASESGSSNETDDADSTD